MRLILLAAALLFALPAAAEATYGLSLLGALKLPADFTHFPDADPNAPKGGTVSLAAVGSFDSLNPFIVRGSPAGAVARVWDTLMADNADEGSASYAHVAQSVDVAADGLSVTFVLRPEAHFNDGTPVLASDVVWSFNTLREKGRPLYRTYWGDVADAQATADRTVVFHFKDANRELAMILGQVPVLPEHWWKGRDFSAPLSDPPLGSGPYRVSRVEMGRTIELQRVPDWWATNMPTGRGLNNFGTLRYEYFRDPTVAFEAFKAGQVDFRQENSAKNWATGYDFPAVTKGLVKLESLPHRLPTGMQGFAMNTRREPFKDPRVREAMDAVFDFQWMNKNLFYGNYTRTESYFSNSEYASSGVPQGPELALLEPFRSKLPPGLFNTPFTLPGDRRVRQQPRGAALRNRPLETGWLDGEGAQAGQRRRAADELRVAAERPGVRAHRPALRAVARPARHRRAHPHHRRRAIPEAHGRPRFRHGRGPGRGKRVARQRAGRLLVLPQRQRTRHPERGRGMRPGGRCDGRCDRGRQDA